MFSRLPEQVKDSQEFLNLALQEIDDISLSDLHRIAELAIELTKTLHLAKDFLKPLLISECFITIDKLMHKIQNQANGLSSTALLQKKLNAKLSLGHTRWLSPTELLNRYQALENLIKEIPFPKEFAVAITRDWKNDINIPVLAIKLPQSSLEKSKMENAEILRIAEQNNIEYSLVERGTSQYLHLIYLGGFQLDRYALCLGQIQIFCLTSQNPATSLTANAIEEEPRVTPKLA